MSGFLQLTLNLFSDAIAQNARSLERLPNAHNKPHQLLMPSTVVSSPHGETIASVMPPSHFAHPRANRQALLSGKSGKRVDQGGGECIVAYELRRGKRKSIGFIVGADGLVVSAPRWVPLYEIDKALQEKSAWILAKLVQAQERQQRLAHARIQWQAGASLLFLGDKVMIVIDPRQEMHSTDSKHGIAQLHKIDNTPPGTPHLALHIGLPHDASEQRIRDCVQAWLMRQATRLFEERLNHFAPRLGVRWTKLRLSNAASRWGSASSDGSIRLNWRLIHFRQSVIDYVVVHELSHLRVMDHSPKFWTTVESIMPDYTLHKAQLREEAIPQW